MNNNTSTIKVALADDQVLIRDAIAALIRNFGDCEVIFTAINGIEVLEKINQQLIPEVLILDFSMPLMDGYQTAVWLQANYPKIKILMLTMYDNDVTLIHMLKAGVKGFLKKDVPPEELHYAIKTVMGSGYFYNNNITGKMVNKYLREPDDQEIQQNLLNRKEMDFLKLTCSELTYKEIGTELNLNPRAVERIRETLFNKLDVKTRAGLAMIAIRNGLVHF